MLTFGPVPSRRLGRSLGINNIPPKICTYSCVYCQLGKTFKMKIEPTEFYQPKEILSEVQNKVEKAKKMQESIDYLTFVPDGEPTLDINLGQEIKLIKSLGIKVAVITNASLMEQEQVRENLKEADLVSLKVDSVEEKIWRKVDRPNRNLSLKDILNSMLKFKENFKGEIITETMLVQDINDDSQHLKKVANFLAELKPNRAYLSVPIRPPADSWVQSPSEGVVNQSYHIFKEKLDQVECLIGYEGNAFAFTGNVEEDLLSITSVHPMREEALKDFLKRAHSDWSVIDRLIKQGQLVESEYKGHKFYIRKFKKKGGKNKKGDVLFFVFDF
jgi:wyosine [tRNA(Phe)-imidazoG37] synthetase (radical SAM superfamily)